MNEQWKSFIQNEEVNRGLSHIARKFLSKIDMVSAVPTKKGKNGYRLKFFYHETLYHVVLFEENQRKKIEFLKFDMYDYETIAMEDMIGASISVEDGILLYTTFLAFDVTPFLENHMQKAN